MIWATLHLCLMVIGAPGGTFTEAYLCLQIRTRDLRLDWPPSTGDADWIRPEYLTGLYDRSINWPDLDMEKV